MATVELRFLSGARAGTSVTLATDRVLRLGRGPGNDVVFDPMQDLVVSTHHAELRPEPQGLRLVDLGSANGTLVAGNRITSHLLGQGETVTFGTGGPQVAFTFAAAPAAAAPTPARPAPPAPGSGAKRKGKGAIVALVAVAAVTFAAAAVAVLVLRKPDADRPTPGTTQAPRPAASVDERRWLEDVDLLVSPGAPPASEELRGATLIHRDGAVQLRGSPQLRRALRGVRVASVPLTNAGSVAREAYAEAQRLGVYILGQPIVNIDGRGGQGDLHGRLFITLPLSAEQLAAAGDDSAGALYLSRSGPQFVFGRLDRGARTVTIATAHLSAYSGAVFDPSKPKAKQTWTEWAKSWAPSRDKLTGYWTPKCEPPLMWTRISGIKEGDPRITANGCSVPDVAASAHWATTMRSHKKFVSKDNPSGLCDIKSACDAHDLCYVVCGKSKETCDTAFNDSLIRLTETCIARLPDDGKLGEHIMHIRYWLVKYAAAPTGWVGRQLYKSAQQDVCECQATVVGKWLLDRDELMASAGEAAKAMVAQRGGSAAEWEPKMRQMFERVSIELEFSESGAFQMRGRLPRWGAQRTDARWVLAGDRIVLSNLSGSRFPGQLTLVSGKIHISAPEMNGMRWVLVRK